MIKPTTLIFRLGMPFQIMVSHYSIGILCKKYPAKPGEKRFASQDAIKKYGHDLFIKVGNISEEVLRTQHECTVQVTWNLDGSPELKVIKRNLILIPGGGAMPGIN